MEGKNKMFNKEWYDIEDIPIPILPFHRDCIEDREQQDREDNAGFYF